MESRLFDSPEESAGEKELQNRPEESYIAIPEYIKMEESNKSAAMHDIGVPVISPVLVGRAETANVDKIHS